MHKRCDSFAYCPMFLTILLIMQLKNGESYLASTNKIDTFVICVYMKMVDMFELLNNIFKMLNTAIVIVPNVTENQNLQVTMRSKIKCLLNRKKYLTFCHFPLWL